MSIMVHLIRHAESEANVGLSSSSPDLIPLTEKGVLQAKQVSDSVTFVPDLIVVSPFLRAKQTAAPLIERFPSASVQSWAVQEFTYLSETRCGHSTPEERKPLVDEYWRQGDPDYCDGGNSESFRTFISRVRETLRKLERSPQKIIAVVSHGQFIRAGLWLILTGRNEINQSALREYHAFLQAVPLPNTARFSIWLNENQTFLSSISAAHLELADMEVDSVRRKPFKRKAEKGRGVIDR